MTSELKACPICNSKACAPWISPLNGVKYTTCTNNLCSLFHEQTAVEDWQSRPIEDALRSLLKEVKEDAEYWYIHDTKDRKKFYSMVESHRVLMEKLKGVE
jgi:hypothetical protein